jgi:hypothetical protein
MDTSKIMKAKLFCLMLFMTLKLFSQNCDAPDELFRKRHTIDGMTWGKYLYSSAAFYNLIVFVFSFY